MLLPSLAFSLLARILFFVSFVFLFVYSFRYITFSIFLATVFLIFSTFVINYIASDNSFTSRHLQLYIILIVISFIPTLKKYNSKEKYFLLYLILIINLFSLVITFMGLIDNSHAARSFSKSSEIAKEISEQGIGGYGFIYFNITVIPVLVFLKRTLNARFVKLLSNLNLILILLVAFYSNFLIAILITITIILYITYHNTNKKVFSIGLFFVIFSSFIFSNNVEKFEKLTYDFVVGTSLELKHDDIFRAMKGNNINEGTINLRYERYERSFKMMFINPIIGVMKFDDTGKHSNLIDFTAQFGFLFSYLLFKILFYVPLKIKKFINKNEKKYIDCFILSLLVLGLLNNYPMQLSVSFVLLFLVIELQQTNKLKNEINSIYRGV